jgi:hypothetical protein
MADKTGSSEPPKEVVVTAPLEAVDLSEEATDVHRAVLFGLPPEPVKRDKAPDPEATSDPSAPSDGRVSLRPPGEIVRAVDNFDWNGKAPELRAPSTIEPFREPAIGRWIATRAPILGRLLRLFPLLISAVLAIGFLYKFIIEKPKADLVISGARSRADIERMRAAADAQARAKTREEGLKPTDKPTETPPAQQAVAQPEPIQTPPASAPALRSTEIGSSKIWISSEPSDVLVELDGTVLGRTPILAPAPVRGDKMHFRLSRARFRAWEGEITRDGPEHLRLSSRSAGELVRDPAGRFRLIVSLAREGQ